MSKKSPKALKPDCLQRMPEDANEKYMALESLYDRIVDENAAMVEAYEQAMDFCEALLETRADIICSLKAQRNHSRSHAAALEAEIEKFQDAEQCSQETISQLQTELKSYQNRPTESAYHEVCVVARKIAQERDMAQSELHGFEELRLAAAERKLTFAEFTEHLLPLINLGKRLGSF